MSNNTHYTVEHKLWTTTWILTSSEAFRLTTFLNAGRTSGSIFWMMITGTMISLVVSKRLLGRWWAPKTWPRYWILRKRAKIWENLLWGVRNYAIQTVKFLVMLDFLKMKFRGHKLMNTDSFFDFWDKSDPYLKFLKLREDNTYIEVARTATIQNNLNPDWPAV